MKFSKWKKSKLFWIICLAILTFMLNEILSHYPNVAEKTYAHGLYPNISILLAAISGWIPFSLDDMFYVVTSVWLLALLVMPLFKKMRWRKALDYFLRTVLLVYIAFYWLWGFNYFRSKLNDRLNYTKAKADASELMATFNCLVDEVNNSYLPVDTVEWSQLVSLLNNEYQKHSQDLHIDIRLSNMKPKYLTFSRFFAAGSIGGYYGPFFSEVHVNSYLTSLELPVVMAHEMAHRYGITSEAEANFYAWYVCFHASDQRLKYSANLYLLRYFAYEVYQLEGFKEAIVRIKPEVRADQIKIRDHWRSLMNQSVENMTTAVNDAYLKSNKVEGGIDNYDGVVKCVMDYLNTHKDVFQSGTL